MTERKSFPVMPSEKDTLKPPPLAISLSIPPPDHASEPPKPLDPGLYAVQPSTGEPQITQDHSAPTETSVVRKPPEWAPLQKPPDPGINAGAMAGLIVLCLALLSVSLYLLFLIRR